jgi:hypothetical protein
MIHLIATSQADRITILSYCTQLAFFLKIEICWAPVAHAYYPCYSGGRDQEDHSSKPAQADGSQNPISKKTYHKQLGWQSGSR